MSIGYYPEIMQLPLLDDFMDYIKKLNYGGPKYNFVKINPIPPIPPIPPKPIPCFLKGTHILTTHGEVLIEKLKTTDILLNHLGETIKILDISTFTRIKNNDTHPYIIPKNTKINNFTCNQDLYISKDHAILFNNIFIPVHNTEHKMIQYISNRSDVYEYYHITSENYFTDTIISNGIPTESYGGNLLLKNRNLMLYIFYKVVKENTRKILSKNEFIHIVNKYRLKSNKIPSNHVSKLNYSKQSML